MAYLIYLLADAAGRHVAAHFVSALFPRIGTGNFPPAAWRTGGSQARYLDYMESRLEADVGLFRGACRRGRNETALFLPGFWPEPWSSPSHTAS